MKPLQRLATLIVVFLVSAAGTLSCAPKGPTAQNAPTTPGPEAQNSAAQDSITPAKGSGPSLADRVAAAATAAGLPEKVAAPLVAAARTDPAALEAELAAIRAADPYLTLLVDKRHSLGEDYAPADLVKLDGKSYRLSRAGLELRSEAAAALERMAAAAKADGVTLVVSSTYRSAAYQKKVYSRVVAELGQAGADRESARPGLSQHQLGLAVDFGSIDDSFAKTVASRWLQEKGSRYGYSLSYPKGYEELTGYRWESWHYRYVGTAAAALIDRYFGGIQQYGLLFLDALKRGT